MSCAGRRAWPKWAGRRVAGNAALDQNRTLKGIKADARKILEEAGRTDQEEDQRYGKEQRGDELPEALRTQEGRLSRLKEARQWQKEAGPQAKDVSR
ncbi:MAG: hypothetical protein ACYC0L_09105 [Thermoleophilia bacterium]